MKKLLKTLATLLSSTALALNLSPVKASGESTKSPEKGLTCNEPLLPLTQQEEKEWRQQQEQPPLSPIYELEEELYIHPGSSSKTPEKYQRNHKSGYEGDDEKSDDENENSEAMPPKKRPRNWSNVAAGGKLEGDQYPAERGFEGDQYPAERGFEGDQYPAERGFEGDQYPAERGFEGDQCPAERGFEGYPHAPTNRIEVNNPAQNMPKTTPIPQGPFFIDFDVTLSSISLREIQDKRDKVLKSFSNYNNQLPLDSQNRMPLMTGSYEDNVSEQKLAFNLFTELFNKKNFHKETYLERDFLLYLLSLSIFTRNPYGFIFCTAQIPTKFLVNSVHITFENGKLIIICFFDNEEVYRSTMGCKTNVS